jgi:hypothetical protein
MGVRVRYRNKSTIVAVGGKIAAATKKSTSKLIKCEGSVDSFFMGRASFIMSLFHVVSQWTVLLGGHAAFEGGRAKEEA